MSVSHPFSVVAVTRTLRTAVAVGKRKLKMKKPVFVPGNSYQKSMLTLMDDENVIAAENELTASQLDTKVAVVGNGMALTTILKVGVKWFKKGAVAKAGTYQGVELQPVSFRVVSPDLAIVRTKSGDMVFMSRKKFVTTDPFKMTALATSLTKKYIDAEVKPYASMIFPLVSIDQDVDVKKLLGLRFNDVGQTAVDLFVEKASKHVNFDMDLEGAKVKVVVKIVMRPTSLTRKLPPPPKKFIIKDAFTVWMVSPGQNVPYFVCNVGTTAFTKSK